MGYRWAVLAAVAGLVSLSVAVPAYASAAAPTVPVGCMPRYEIKNSHLSYEGDFFDHGTGWSVSGPGGGTLSLSRDVTASNSYSANVGLSAGAVSAGVGFNVTQSVGYHAGYSYNPPDDGNYGTKWTITAGTHDSVYVFEIHKLCVTVDQGVVGKGTARKVGDLVYKVHGEAPGNPRK